MHRPGKLSGFIVANLVILTATSAAAATLSGTWGGDRLLAVFDARGVALTSDCASGSIRGGVELDADGRFSADGTFQQDAPGPQRGDENFPANTAHFLGRVDGQLMKLVIRPVGVAAPRKYTLRRGARQKLVRCY